MLSLKVGNRGIENRKAKIKRVVFYISFSSRRFLPFSFLFFSFAVASLAPLHPSSLSQPSSSLSSLSFPFFCPLNSSFFSFSISCLSHRCVLSIKFYLPLYLRILLLFLCFLLLRFPFLRLLVYILIRLVFLLLLHNAYRTPPLILLLPSPSLLSFLFSDHVGTLIECNVTPRLIIEEEN